LNNLHLLEDAFNSRSFYILGAGASAGIIPLTNQQGGKIVERHLEHGAFSISAIEIDTIAKRLLGNARYSEDCLRQELINRIPTGAIKAISYQLMTAMNGISPPAQYDVFNTAEYRSVIFNFNVDGLANRFCKRHLVLNAHGVLDPEITHSDAWNELIELCLTYHLEAPLIPNVLLPQKEPFGTTTSGSYKIASKAYPFTTNIVIVGYSFGRNNTELDDWESYLYFTSLFKTQEKPIVVISPYGADQLVHMLCEDLLRKNIFAISAYWNYLASAILESRRMKLMFPHIKDRYRISLDYIYQSILDEKA
jgi:hypothetical protein